MTNEELDQLSEEDRYLVVGIEDGWIEPTNKDLERYYELMDKVKNKSSLQIVGMTVKIGE